MGVGIIQLVEGLKHNSTKKQVQGGCASYLSWDVYLPLPLTLVLLVSCTSKLGLSYSFGFPHSPACTLQYFLIL